ncbi:uncharacterized protein MELLADRAFT_95144 [Melampsora larici-populina 98AG31]|uniref:Uncharacterized protein n=1 Tax=Melampsora larici-populina (strain 98AG31 / pathotype 3-4-7) TaxID=747676 RepID=F4RC98_MELLP|nr:uncharacterized protein MELLADRAFT_95144 [Melampsora larici-populina 98AG31]EGG09702.1 hypothetical protein MELLADRAFT_95144 [Melampsora larici-populina 98AG31]
MPSTRSKGKKSKTSKTKPSSVAPKNKTSQVTSCKRKRTATSSRKSGTGDSHDKEDSQADEDQPIDKNTTETEDPSPTQTNAKKSNRVFQSQFPGLEFDTFEQELDNWSLVKLQEALQKQESRRTKVHKEVRDLVEIMRMEFEKRMLMIALMAGVPEVVIWKLVGLGSKTVKANPWIRFLSFCLKCLGTKMPERNDKDAWVARNQEMAEKWHDLSQDEQDVFKDPYFFALPNLPDYSTAVVGDDQGGEGDDDENGINTNQFDGTTPAPKVHQLSEEEKAKYQPLFEKLVNVEKLHLSHGKPEKSTLVATLQKRSLVAVRKAHHDFSVICQQHHISYYLTSASCGGVDGWSQTFSNNIKFADWALKTPKIPSKFTTYIHRQEVAKEIEAIVPQASDEQKSRLTHQLNEMFGAHINKTSFPKMPDPIAHIKKRGWPIEVIQKPGSKLSPTDLLKGHRKATNAVIQVWLKDIEDGLFVIEPKLINDGEEVIDNTQSNRIESTQSESNHVQQGSSKTKKKQKSSESQETARKQNNGASKSRLYLKSLAAGKNKGPNEDSGDSSTLEDESGSESEEESDNQPDDD